MMDQNPLAPLYCIAQSPASGCNAHRRIVGERPSVQQLQRCMHNEVGNYCVAPIRQRRHKRSR
jgi:hypothetical protein